MSVIGIVCEYNPFHLGHLHQMKESAKLLGDDPTVVCVMSGDFVQRGDAAFFTKHARAEAACRCGADIVIELPLPWSLSSAEGFADGAVKLLQAAGVTHISFGSESGDIDSLTRLAELVADDRTTQGALAEISKNAALPFAKARQLYLREIVGEDAELLSSPNNILAVEYIKSIIKNDYDIKPITIRRIGSAHDKLGETGPKSASELRLMLERGEDISELIPREAYEVLSQEIMLGRVRDKKSFDTISMSVLRMLPEEAFYDLPDAVGGSGRRLYKTLRESGSIYDAAYNAATRPYPAARMRRMLMCALLGIRADHSKLSPPYMRILAMSKKGRAHIKNLGSESSIPVIIRPSSVRALGHYAEDVFSLGARAHDLYRLQFVTNDDKVAGEDWRKGPVIV